jgi:LysM repeat protein
VSSQLPLVRKSSASIINVNTQELSSRRPLLLKGLALAAGGFTPWGALWAQAPGAAPAAINPADLPGAVKVPIELAKDAPDQYTVVRGDTLWDISGKFLAKPWRWPEIWQLNKDQIKNPHLIFPGDVIMLDTSSGTPRLRLGRSVSGGGSMAQSERPDALKPSARVTSLDRAPIPTISAAAIDAFLNRPLIVEEKGLTESARIVGTQEGRVFLGRGDLAYARGIDDKSVTEWHIYRSARPLLDPETRLPIAYEALFVGSARTERNGDPATLRITGTTEEVGVGDRLMPAERARVLNYAPRAPEAMIKGRLVSVYRGVTQAGRNSVVAINAGKSQGLEVGHVLSILQRGALITDREKKEQVRLPDEPAGYMLVFRVFDKIAYGLILDSARSISVGDSIVNPQS